jgi:hypothetical protein
MRKQTSAEYMLVIQIDDDTMVINLIYSLEDDDNENNDYMAEEGFQILEL